jgi:uncharacterized cupredoxin-like copper-binding protein
MKHRTTLTAILLTSLLVAISCGGEKRDSQNPAPYDNNPATGTAASASAGDTSDTASGTLQGSPGGTALVPDVTGGTTVLVMIQDGHIAVREQAIPPGPAVLTVENRGTDVHNLYIEGQGISRAAGDAIPEGKSATVDVVFKPGTYTFYCPILDHRNKGESVQVTIAAP